MKEDNNDDSDYVKWIMFATFFFAAPLYEGFTDFVGLYLFIAEKFTETQVASVMVPLAISNLIAINFAGAIVDRVTNKKALFISAICIVAITSCFVPLFPRVDVLIPTRILQGCANALIIPCLAAMTLGVVGPKKFDLTLPFNETGHHLGHSILIGIACLFTYFWTLYSVFGIITICAVITTIFLLIWPVIDNEIARSQKKKNNTEKEEKIASITDILMNKNIMMLIFVAFTFHLGNGPQLPLVMQKIGTGFDGREGIPLGASAILISHFGMAIMTYIVGKYVEDKRKIIIVAELVIFGRCFYNAYFMEPWQLLLGQLSESLGANIINIMGVLILEEMCKGTGRFAFCVGLYAGADKFGVAVGTIPAQYLAQNVGYQEAFFFCAGCGFFSLLMALTLFYVVEDKSEYMTETRVGFTSTFHPKVFPMQTHDIIEEEDGTIIKKKQKRFIQYIN